MSEKETEFKNNNDAFKFAKSFVNDELLAFFKQAEKNKRYGSLYFHPGGPLKAEFVFHGGICLRCIEPIKGNSCTFNNSTKFW
jgi:hypothetical protein